MYGAGLTGGNAERVLGGCTPVIAPVAAQVPFSEDPARRPWWSKVLFANVDGRLLSEANEILLEPGVGSLASDRHQVGQAVPICVELIDGAQRAMPETGRWRFEKGG